MTDSSHIRWALQLSHFGKKNHEFSHYSVFIFLVDIIYDYLFLVVSTGQTGGKWLRKFLFISIRLRHHFVWQVLSIDVSAFFSALRDWLLPI